MNLRVEGKVGGLRDLSQSARAGRGGSEGQKQAFLVLKE